MIDLKAEAVRIVQRYPEGRARSALIPLLHLAQERDGYVTPSAMNEIAGFLGLTAAEVQSVASFYTMLYQEPKGDHVISICHNMACTLLGAEKLIRDVEKHLGITCGQTTSDGVFTLERAECLAHCEIAPMIQVDYDEMIGPLDRDKAISVLEELRRRSKGRPAYEHAQSASQGAVVSEPTGAISPEQPDVATAPFTVPEPASTVAEASAEESEADANLPGSVPPPREVEEEPALIDSIEISTSDRELLDRSTSKRGEPRKPSAPERLLETPPLDTGVGPGPAAPEELGLQTEEPSEPQRRPRGAE